MPPLLYLTGARLVLADEIIEDGALLLEHGQIRAINPDGAPQAKVVCLQGQTLMAGLIDLHCDAFEKEFEPRPDVHFPLDFALAQADKQNAAAGVTTVFHALSFAHNEFGVRNNEVAASLARGISNWRPTSLVENRVHCRYEVTDSLALPILLQLLDEGTADLISLMDHRPGQGQFANIAAYKAYHKTKYHRSDLEIDQLLISKHNRSKEAFRQVRQLIQKAQEKHIFVASHDNDHVAQIKRNHKLGVTLAEFPVNLETAQAAQDVGMTTLFGAPNILRGQSQSGAIKALDAVQHQVVDCLCGDYSSASLLAALFKLPEVSALSLPQAAALVTSNPAKAVGLHDRGVIQVGKRADLISVVHLGKQPQCSRVWVKGREVYQANYRPSEWA